MRLIMSLLGNRVRKVVLFCLNYACHNAFCECPRASQLSKSCDCNETSIFTPPLCIPLGVLFGPAQPTGRVIYTGTVLMVKRDVDNPLMEGMVLGVSTITSALISRVWLFSDERSHLQGMGVH